MTEPHLILHVKGTEGETTVLPRLAVQQAMAEGRMTDSQLIWSSQDNAWKQAREHPEVAPQEHLILHVKGTDSETRQLPKPAVRDAISRGEISHSQLIWSAAQNSWKQVREMPDLLPSQKVAPAPIRATTAHLPHLANDIILESPHSPVARAAQSAQGAKVAVPAARVVKAMGTVPPKSGVSARTPQARNANSTSAGMPKIVRASSATPASTSAIGSGKFITPAANIMTSSSAKTASYKVKVDDHAHPLKWVCIVLGSLIALVVGINYLLVDRPLNSNMDQAGYPNMVYAHFGAFVQPNVMVIHIPASTALTPDKLPSFLVTLAHNTPQSPLTNDLFSRVALTSGWMAQYSFSGFSWNELGSMSHESSEHIKESILERLGDASGRPLARESTMSTDAQRAANEKTWNNFVSVFTAP